MKTQTSTSTHSTAGVLVFDTDGRASLPGFNFITPVAFAIASTPESASTMPTNDPQLCANPPVSGWTFRIASPRCGIANAPSKITTTAVGTAMRKASPPVWRGP